MQPHDLTPSQLTEVIIRCSYQVSNVLGSGFVEKVYENALAYELGKAGLRGLQQHPIKVMYDGIIVGDFVADLLVEGQVLVELKAVRALEDVHTAQCLNYLKATGIRTCLLLNSGRPRVEIRRLVL